MRFTFPKNQKSFPNQVKVSIVKNEHLEGSFFKVSAYDCMTAAATLSPSALKLWLMLSSKANGCQWFLCKNEAEKWGLSSEATLRNARQELIEKGYLYKIPCGNYNYFFRSSLSIAIDEALIQDWYRDLTKTFE